MSSTGTCSSCERVKVNSTEPVKGVTEGKPRSDSIGKQGNII